MLVSAGRSFYEAVNNIAAKTDLFYNACVYLNISVNTNETNAIYFVKGPNNLVNISIKGALMNHKTLLKFLGRIINANLRFQQYYLEALKDYQSGSNITKRMTNRHSSFFSPKKALVVYKFLVRSKIEYSQIHTFSNILQTRYTDLSPSKPASLSPNVKETNGSNHF